MAMLSWQCQTRRPFGGKFKLMLRTPRIFGLQKLGIHFSVPRMELLAHGLHSARLRKGQVARI